MRKDLNRDLYLTSTEAVAYGLIDGVIAPRRGLAAGVTPGRLAT